MCMRERQGDRDRETETGGAERGALRRLIKEKGRR